MTSPNLSDITAISFDEKKFVSVVISSNEDQIGISVVLWTGGWFSIKMPSYKYGKSHCGDKMILQLFYLYNGISFTGNMTSLYLIRAQMVLIGSFKQKLAKDFP